MFTLFVLYAICVVVCTLMLQNEIAKIATGKNHIRSPKTTIFLIFLIILCPIVNGIIAWNIFYSEYKK